MGGDYRDFEREREECGFPLNLAPISPSVNTALEGSRGESGHFINSSNLVK